MSKRNSPRFELMDKPILELDSVSAGYGPITILHDLSLEVFPGEIVTIIGANGAGKTTTLHLISGLIPLQKGTIRFLGSDENQFRAHELVGAGLVHVPEGRKIFTRMTVQENLDLGAFSRTDRKDLRRDYDHVFELFPILQQRKSQLGGTLSGGEQQMLAIGRALMSRPKLLLLDEPSMGVAPLLTQKIFDALKKLNEEGMTILLVEQNAHLALTLADRGYVLELGRIVRTNSGENLLSDPRVRQAYLGE